MERIDCERCLNSEFYDGDKIRCKLMRCNPRYEDAAYEEIKDRKGKMVNGLFLKTADL